MAEPQTIGERKMPKLIKSIREIKVGDFFEDCSFHPCVCVLAGDPVDKDGVEGISLFDGSGPRCCSAKHCGLRILSVEETLHWKFYGPRDQKLKRADRWWPAKKPIQPPQTTTGSGAPGRV